MNKKPIAWLVGATLGVSFGALSLPLLAQDVTDPSTEGTMQTPTAPQTLPSETDGQGVSDAILQMTASDLMGQTIVNASGDELGTIDSVVRDDSGQLHAVVSMGGFLGFGGTRAVIPISQLQSRDGQIATRSAVSPDELQQSAAYQEEAYEAVDDTTRLSEAVAQPSGIAAPGAAGGQPLASFQELDVNGDGYIDQQEAQASEPLSGNWQQVDINADDQLDQAEFSAFEAGFQMGTQGRQQSAAPMPQESAAASFEELDANNDGYISQGEASGHDPLNNNWQQADANADGHVDEAEFSAFESTFQQ